jgi:hypothetical protein
MSNESKFVDDPRAIEIEEALFDYEVALDNATAFLDSPSQQLTLSSDKEYGR